MPVDQVEVAESSSWYLKMQKELQRAYSGLPNASAASEAVGGIDVGHLQAGLPIPFFRRGGTVGNGYWGSKSGVKTMS